MSVPTVLVIKQLKVAILAVNYQPVHTVAYDLKSRIRHKSFWINNIAKKVSALKNTVKTAAIYTYKVCYSSEETLNPIWITIAMKKNSVPDQSKAKKH
jgi:hypothetical protein